MNSIEQVERELRVELSGDELQAVQRCLSAQTDSEGTPEVQVTTVLFDVPTVHGASLGRKAQLELRLEWADGPARLREAPAVLELREPGRECTRLRRWHVPRASMRAALRPSTKAELYPEIPDGVRPRVAVRSTRRIYADPEGAFLVSLDFGVGFQRVDHAFELGEELPGGAEAVLTVRPLRGEVPSWLTGLARMGPTFEPLVRARAALSGGDEEHEALTLELEDEPALPSAHATRAAAPRIVTPIPAEDEALEIEWFEEEAPAA